MLSRFNIANERDCWINIFLKGELWLLFFCFVCGFPFEIISGNLHLYVA